MQLTCSAMVDVREYQRAAAHGVGGGGGGGARIGGVPKPKPYSYGWLYVCELRGLLFFSIERLYGLLFWGPYWILGFTATAAKLFFLKKISKITVPNKKVDKTLSPVETGKSCSKKI